MSFTLSTDTLRVVFSMLNSQMEEIPEEFFRAYVQHLAGFGPAVSPNFEEDHVSFSVSGPVGAPTAHKLAALAIELMTLQDRADLVIRVDDMHPERLEHRCIRTWLSSNASYVLLSPSGVTSRQGSLEELLLAL